MLINKVLYSFSSWSHHLKYQCWYLKYDNLILARCHQAGCQWRWLDHKVLLHWRYNAFSKSTSLFSGEHWTCFVSLVIFFPFRFSFLLYDHHFLLFKFGIAEIFMDHSKGVFVLLFSCKLYAHKSDMLISVLILSFGGYRTKHWEKFPTMLSHALLLYPFEHVQSIHDF